MPPCNGKAHEKIRRRVASIGLDPCDGKAIIKTRRKVASTGLPHANGKHSRKYERGKKVASAELATVRRKST